MIGLVIVSHSRPLGEAIAGLARQMASSELQIAVAAGIGPEREEFGTDAIEISEAIQGVYSPDGVVVLMDLGSAILSAQMALELLPPEISEKVTFCPGPVVEGAVAAAVQASLGSSAEEVCREARQALAPKIEQLAPEETAAESPAGSGAAIPAGALPAEAAGEAHSTRLVLRNQHGLHARPAARFVQLASRFDAGVQVTNLTSGKGPVSARSLNALATLGAVNGDEIQITAQGVQASQAIQALQELVEANFGEGDGAGGEAKPATPAIPPATQAVTAPPPGEPGVMQAIPVSEGIALGPLYPYRPAPPPLPSGPAADPGAEWERLQGALAMTEKDIHQRRQGLRGTLDEESAAIFDAHVLILQDPELLEGVKARIREQSMNAAQAWNEGIQQVAQSYRELGDPYLAQRAADVLDVGRQVLFALSGKGSTAQVALPGPVILLADELTPTETAGLDMEKVLGLITIKGGPTSHSSILARALGIPALTGASLAVKELPEGTVVGLDGFTGRLWVDPAERVQQDLEAQREAWLERREQWIRSSREPAVTRDGQRIEIAANIGSAADARAAVHNGAEAVGLLRTEFLFLSRTEPPSEEEQAAELQAIIAEMQGRPVLVRTLDVGGDKALPYLEMPAEDNPFLGVRAIRLSLSRPELFSAQLRAILRAGAHGPLRIMFPMVANLEEVKQAKLLLDEAHQALEGAGIPHAWPVETGIMIEVPAAALMSDRLAEEVDFFSIGTNDLTQYTLAAERGNPALSGFADALHPAVLRLIGRVAEAAHAHGKWAGVCGELAGDAVAAPVLAGLGIDELSLAPAGIPRIKAVVRKLELAEARRLASQALEMDSAAAVRELAGGFLDED